MKIWWHATLLLLSLGGNVKGEKKKEKDDECRVVRKGELTCQWPSTSSMSMSTSMSSSVLRSVRRLHVSCVHSIGQVTADWRPDILERVPRLRHLEISACNLGRLSSPLFEPLEHLRSLDVSENELISLAPSLLCSLSHLRRLNVSSNAVQEVSQLGSRPCGQSLQSVDLSNNLVSSLPSSALSHLANLEKLDLSGNRLNFMHDEALDGLGQLQHLVLSHNHLVAMPTLLFSHCCPMLTELHLQHNQLSVLSSTLLAPLEHLVLLNLSNNALVDLEANTFVSLVRLVALDLSHNRLDTLEPGLLSGLGALQLLDLSHNRLHYLPAHAFVSQVNLHMLRLNHNHVDNIHVQAFVGLDVLSSLDLAHNNLADLPDVAMASVVSIVDLRVSNNLLTAVPRALKRLPALRSLDLGQNRIGHVHKSDLEGLSNLDALRLSDNGLEHLESDVFELVPRVRILNVADNRLKMLNLSIFNALNELTMLRLDNNLLGDINGLLAGQTTLQWLNVSSNRLPWFDFAFIPKSLEWLDVSHNQVEELGNFYKLDEGFKLRTLIAEFNEIKSIDALSIPDNVHTIRLKGNRISHVDVGTFAEKTKLRSVDLSNNKLQTLQVAQLAIRNSRDSMSEPSKKAVDFWLADNPFRCDCEMEWLARVNDPEPGQGLVDSREQSSKLGLTVADLDALTCIRPSTWPFSTASGSAIAPASSAASASASSAASGSASRVELMRDLPSTSFLCVYEAHCFALCLCCDFFACDCRMQCPQGCTCLHDSSWSANVIECSHRSHTEVPPLIPMDATAIFLDGNNFTGILESQAFIGRKRVKELYLNNSRIEAISNQTFNGLSELRLLHLDNNNIDRLEGYEFSNLSALQELYLHYNRLTYIHMSTFDALQGLRIIDLSHNRLHTFPVWTMGQRLMSVKEIKLAGNAWSCECDFVKRLQTFVNNEAVNQLRVVDYQHLRCRDDGIGHQISRVGNVTCSQAQPVVLDVGQVEEENELGFDLVPLLLSLATLCLLLSCLSVLVFVFRTPLRVWLHSKYNLRVLQSNCSVPGPDCFHAFVSFGMEENELVHQALLPHLEQEFRLTLQSHSKTERHLDNVVMLKKACRHVIVLSRAFVDSEWKRVGALRRQVMKPVILIVLESFSPILLAAHPELEVLMKTSVVLKWNETGFWNKLRFHLPDPLKYSGEERDLYTFQARRHGVEEKKESNDSKEQDMRGSRSVVSSQRQRSPWAYSGLLSSNTASPMNTSSLLSSSSPARTSSSSESTATHLLSNPSEHIYHTLEPMETSCVEMAFDTLGRLDVMLPNGQFVPATLVRSHGHVVPIVEETCVNSLGLSPRNSNGNGNTEWRRQQERRGQRGASGQLTRHFV